MPFDDSDKTPSWGSGEPERHDEDALKAVANAAEATVSGLSDSFGCCPDCALAYTAMRLLGRIMYDEREEPTKNVRQNLRVILTGAREHALLLIESGGAADGQHAEIVMKPRKPKNPDVH